MSMRTHDVSTAFSHRRVRVTAVNSDATEVVVRDGLGWTTTLDGTIRAKGTGLPEEDEIWLIERIGMQWVLRAQERAGEMDLGPEINALIAAKIAQELAAAAEVEAIRRGQEAALAAGIIGGDATVLIQPGTPGPEHRNDHTLWIDTSFEQNRPMRWSPEENQWILVVDQIAIEAARQAVLARAEADEARLRAEDAEIAAEAARGLAEDALQEAEDALAAASGKGRVIYGDPLVTPGEEHSLLIGPGNRPYIWDADLGQWVAVPDDMLQQLENELSALQQELDDALNDLVDLQLDLVGVQGMIDGKSTIYPLGSSPTLGPEDVGDMRLVAGGGVEVWTGTAWEVADPRVAEAVNAAADALGLATTKSTTYYKETPPTAADIEHPETQFHTNDFWLRTTDNRLHRWDGSVWMEVKDKAISDVEAGLEDAVEDLTELALELVGIEGRVDGKSTVYVQDTPPADVDGPEDTGDIWIDTFDGGRVYKVWDGAQWVITSDPRIEDILGDLDTKITTYYLASAPSPSTYDLNVGDLWVRESDNRLHRWDGSDWIDVKDAAIGRSLIDNPSRTGEVGRWTSSDPDTSTLSVVGRVIDTQDVNVLQAEVTGGGVQFWSSADTDDEMFTIDPTKAYRISVWLEDEKAVTPPATQIYFGVHAFRASGSMGNLTQVSLNGVAGARSNNFYFWQERADDPVAGGVPIGAARLYVGYLMPAGTDPAKMKGLGTNITRNAIMDADLVKARVRILNWGNPAAPDGARKIWIGHPTVTEVDPDTITRISEIDSDLGDVINDLVTIEGRVDGKATIYHQPTAPEGLGAADQGDLWIDTSNGGRVYWVWDGTQWLLADDPRVSEVLDEVTTKITTYWSETAPTPPGLTPGDLWFRVPDNRLHIWDGTQWLDGSDVALKPMIDNFSKTNERGRWTVASPTDLIGLDLDGVNGQTMPIMAIYNAVGTSNSPQLYSNGYSDGCIEIDPAKAYRISLLLNKSALVGGINFGLNVFGGSDWTDLPVIGVNQDGQAQSPTSNFYFRTTPATTEEVAGYVRHVAYIMPTGTDPARMKGLGTVTRNALLPSNARRLRIRIFNTGNGTGGTQTSVNVAQPEMDEIDPDSVLKFEEIIGEIDDVRTITDGKITVYYATTPPVSSPTPDPTLGSIWRQLSGQQIIAEWRYSEGVINPNSLEWKSVEYDDAVLRSLNVGKLLAGLINVAIGIDSAGYIRSGDPNSRYAMMDSTGFKAEVVPQEDNGPGDPVTIARLGSTGDNYLMFSNDDGEMLGGFSNEGQLTGQSLDISEDAWLNGTILMGGDADAPHHRGGEYGPVILGRALLDPQFISHLESHPSVDVGNMWTLAIGFGNVAEGHRAMGGWSDLNTSSGEYRRELVTATFDAQNARTYRVDTHWGHLRRIGGSYGIPNYIGEMYLRSSTSAGASVAYDTGNLHPHSFPVYGGANGSGFTQGTGIYYLRGGEDIPVGTVNLMFYVSVPQNIQVQYGPNCSADIMVTDAGRSTSSYQNSLPSGVWRGGTQEEPPTPQPPAKKRYTKTYTSNWTKVWTQFGETTNASWHRNRLVAGRGGSSWYRSYAGFPSMTSDLSGADIEKVEIYVYCQGDYASSSMTYGLHNSLNAPSSSEPTRSVTLGTQTWKRATGYWLSVPSTRWAGIKSGSYRGFWIGRNTSNTNPVMYFHRHDSANKPKIRVTFKK